MPTSREEKGERATYSARYRLTIPGATGLDDPHDPSTCPGEAVVIAINVRVEDGILLSRGGQAKVSEQAPNAGDGGAGECIYGMIEVEGGARLFLNPSGPVEEELDCYDEILANNYVRLTGDDSEIGLSPGYRPACSVGDNTKARFCFCWWGDKLLVASNVEIVYEIVLPEGVIDTTKIKVREVVTLRTYTVSSICVLPGFPDIVYFGTTNGKVFSYDGTTISDISPTGPTNRIILFHFASSLWATSDDFISRYAGQTTWEDATIPVGAPPTGLTAFVPTSAAELNGYAYVGGKDTYLGTDYGVIVKVSPSGTCVLASVFDDSPHSCRLVPDIVAHDGDIYYYWTGIQSVTEVHYLVRLSDEELVLIASENGGALHRLLSHAGVLYGGVTIASSPKFVRFFTGATLSFATLVDTGTLLSDSTGAVDMIGF
jgi:hypothetical protein